MPDFRSILADIKKRKFAPVYLLSGAEPYYLDKLTEALEDYVVAEEDKEFDQTILFGADANAGMIMEAAGRFPMMSEYRLVILKEAQAMHQAKSQLDKLKSYMSNPGSTTVLAIVYKGDKFPSSEMLKMAKKNSSVVIFDSPLIKEYKVGGVIKDYCFAEKIKIEDKAIDLLVANVGASLGKLFSEIEKLRVASKGEDKKITLDMVHEHIGVSKEFNVFELVNAMVRRDYFQSINILKHLEENPKANPTAMISGSVFKNFQQLLLASFSQDKSEAGLMKELELSNPYALRDIRAGLQKYNASQLVTAIHAIRDFDRKSKGVDSFQKEYPLLLEMVCRILTL